MRRCASCEGSARAAGPEWPGLQVTPPPRASWPRGGGRSCAAAPLARAARGQRGRSGQGCRSRHRRGPLGRVAGGVHAPLRLLRGQRAGSGAGVARAAGHATAAGLLAAWRGAFMRRCASCEGSARAAGPEWPGLQVTPPPRASWPRGGGRSCAAAPLVRAARGQRGRSGQGCRSRHRRGPLGRVAGGVHAPLRLLRGQRAGSGAGVARAAGHATAAGLLAAWRGAFMRRCASCEGSARAAGPEWPGLQVTPPPRASWPRGGGRSCAAAPLVRAARGQRGRSGQGCRSRHRRGPLGRVAGGVHAPLRLL